MRKVISFCVWGNKNIYNYGIYENALIIPKLFPDWSMIVYYTKTANLKVINELKKFNYVRCIECDLPNHYKNNMLRFLAGIDINYDIAIFRDADSRLIQRDVVAVNEWINSGKDIHILRDNYWNGIENRISAGLWGVQREFLNKINFKEMFYNFITQNLKNEKTLDEIFLQKFVYPHLNENNSIIHSPFHKWENWAKNFPQNAENISKGFCGQIIRNTPNASKIFF